MTFRTSSSSASSYRGAIESARPDIARPSKLWGLTSRDWTTWHHIARVDIARPNNAAPDKTVVSLSSSCSYRLLLILQIKQWCQSTVESNMLIDKEIKSCLSRFDSGAYSPLQFLRAVSHLWEITRSPYSRGTTATAAAATAAAATRTNTRTGRRPCQQRQLQERRNRQRQLLEIDQSINKTINLCFIVRPNVDQRASQLSLPHVG